MEAAGGAQEEVAARVAAGHARPVPVPNNHRDGKPRTIQVHRATQGILGRIRSPDPALAAVAPLLSRPTRALVRLRHPAGGARARDRLRHWRSAGVVAPVTIRELPTSASGTPF